MPDMEEAAQCRGCGSLIWWIFKDRVECANCGKEYRWPPLEQDLKAGDIIRLVNDNH